MIGRITGTLAVGALMAVIGQTAANAAACVNTTVATLLTAGFSCTQQDKVWSNFSSGNGENVLPGGATASFNLINVGGVDQHTLTIGPPSTGFVQNTTYDLHYTISIAPGNPGVTFTDVTAGILFASPGGTASLTKLVTPNLGSAFTLSANGGTPSSTGPVGAGVTSINLDDDFFTDTSNVTGFANTFTERVPVPEPATLVLLGSGLLGVGLLRRRR